MESGDLKTGNEEQEKESGRKPALGPNASSFVKKVLLNKYFIATLVFLVLIIFVDEYSLRVSSRLGHQVDELHAEEQALVEAIRQDSINDADLRGSLDAKERYGRENYYMKRSNEDVFVIK